MTRLVRPATVHLLLFLLCLTGGVASAAAQVRDSVAPVYDDPPAHVSFVDGTAVLERDGRLDDAPVNMPLLAGDRIRTGSGRVEVVFADGSVLHLDTGTTLDFQSDSLVRLLEGRIRLSIPGPAREVDYRIDTSAASAIILGPGDYRIALTPRSGDVDLAVLRGAAELVNDRGRRELRAGERAFARADAPPSYPYVFNSASWDSFDRWSEMRRDERLGISTRYLPDEVRPYAASFDRYGTWRYDTSYGNVWYPTVAVDWRPYYYGRWTSLRPYGWTWIGSDRWAWPTHHYGRWGISAGVWFWIPGRSWAPAWVSWAYAPGYVSWCPLGWNNRPVVQIVNVNVYGRYSDPWRAWTVLPRQHFGTGYVSTRVVRAEVIDARVRGAFVLRDGAPDAGGYAVPRASAPIRAPGAAVPRYRADAPGFGQQAAPGRPAAAPSSPRASAPGVRPADGYAPGGVQRAVPRGAPQTGTYGAPTGEPLAPRAPDRIGAPSGDRTDQPRQRSIPTEAQPAPRATDRYNPAYGVPSRRADRGYEAGAPPSSPPGGYTYERRSATPQAGPRPAPRDNINAPPVYSREPRGQSDAPAPYVRAPRSDGGRPPAGESRAVPRSPDAAAPPPANRSAPGMDRRAPERSAPPQARPRGRGGR